MAYILPLLLLMIMKQNYKTSAVFSDMMRQQHQFNNNEEEADTMAQCPYITRRATKTK
jgi:hypothetical protein